MTCDSDKDDRRGMPIEFPLRTSKRKGTETMSTSLSPDELLSQARAGSTDHLGELLELYRHYLGLLARHRNRAEPAGEARRLGPGARHAAGSASQFRQVPRIERNAVRLLAAADHGRQPGEPAAPLPGHPRPRCPPGTGAGRPPGPVLAAAGPRPGRPDQFAQPAGVPPRAGGPAGRRPRNCFPKTTGKSSCCGTWKDCPLPKSASAWGGRWTAWRSSGCGGWPGCARSWET